MKDCSPPEWNAVLFELDGRNSCLREEEVEEAVRDCVRKLESLPGFRGSRVLTDRPGVEGRLRRAGVPCRLVAEMAYRSEDERIRAACRMSAAGDGPVLVCNLHHPFVSLETLSRALGETCAVSVREEVFTVHRFFTFRYRGMSFGPQEEVPSGDVLLEWRLDAADRIAEMRTARPSEARPAGPDTLRAWGTFVPASEGEGWGSFLLPEKYDIELPSGKWVRTDRREREITGRNDFPVIARWSDAFAFGTPADLRRIEERVASGRAAGVALGAEESLRVSNEIDRLRARRMALPSHE